MKPIFEATHGPLVGMRNQRKENAEMKKSLVFIMIGLLMLGVIGNVQAESSGGGLSLGHTAEDVQCNGCVNDTDLATAAVTEPKLATGVVTTGKIADGAVTDAKITGPISAAKLEKPANMIVVAKSGGDFMSIAAALASIGPTADNPYHVKVMPGVYNECNIGIGSYVHLQGAGYDTTTIQCNDSYAINIGGTTNVTISGFTIKGAWAGISLDHCHSTTITENRITENTFGINIVMSWSSKIVRNIISGNSGDGIHTVFYAASIIENTISENGGCGIGHEQTAGNIIERNTITSNSGCGISVYQSGQVLNNRITGNGGSGDIITGFDYYYPGSLNISFNVFDTISVFPDWKTWAGNYNTKSDGSPVR